MEGKGLTFQLRLVEVTGAISWKKLQSLKNGTGRAIRNPICGQTIWFDIAEGITTAEARFKKSYARAWFSLV
jgi:hypothetical protein